MLVYLLFKVNDGSPDDSELVGKMRKLLKFATISVLSLFVAASISVEHIKRNFETNICIKGSLSNIITAKETETFIVKELKSNVVELPSKNYSIIENFENQKNALSKLHELAQFNEIDYFFRLVKEEGPDHNKLFTVSLSLGNEEFQDQDTSLKKAQRKVAILALTNTEYESPPVQEKQKNEAASTPTVLLNNLCAKLGIGVEYYLVNKDLPLNLNVPNEKPMKSYLQKLNDSMYSEVRVRKEEPQTKGPFKVGVEVGDLFFYGTSHTIQSARHEAASKAIDHLVKEIRDGNFVCLQEGSEEECKEAKNRLKSPISLIYETAQLRNMQVEFEIIEESGPSHKRVFVTKCTLGHLSTTGQGSSKKESKKVAATNMLEQIDQLPEVTQEMYVKSAMKQKKKKGKKKHKVLKTNFDIISMHVDNIISSVRDYELPVKNSADKHSKNEQPKHFKTSYQDGILELSNTLQFEIQYMDFKEEGKFYTIMSLHINPDYICLGEGTSSKMARNTAARGGLKLLNNIDFGNHFKSTKLLLLESEIKEKINILLTKEIYEEAKDS